MSNQFREKLSLGRRLLGTHVHLTDYHLCELLGQVGFDYLWIDMEHVAINPRTMETHLIAAKAAGIPCLVRASWNEVPYIKQVLEAGPDAIVVPMVNSVEEAQRMIDACIYPPEGKRGYGPCRAVCYGLEDSQEYIDHGSKDVCRFVQIESEQAVNAMPGMAEIPYLDGFIIGPMDMSASVGELGKGWRSRKTNQLIDQAIRTAHESGKYIGLSTGASSEEELSHWMSRDLDFLSAGSDIGYLLSGSQRMLQAMQRLSAKE